MIYIRVAQVHMGNFFLISCSSWLPVSHIITWQCMPNVGQIGAYLEVATTCDFEMPDILTLGIPLITGV